MASMLSSRRLRYSAFALAAGFAAFALQLAIKFAQSPVLGENSVRIVDDSLAAALRSQNFWATSAWYLISGTVLHAIILVTPVVIAKDAAGRLRWARRDFYFRAVPVLALYYLGIALFNQYWFPRSRAIPGADLIALQLGPYLPHILSVGAAVLAALFSYWFVALASRLARVAAVLIALISITPATLFRSTPPTAGKPGTNIVFIGIDSLRPDHLAYRTPASRYVMPSLNAWLDSARVYADAVTPMARTYPALVSVLTGLYPINSGARENLFPRHQVRVEHSLANRLSKRGYFTAFSNEATQFSNIDESYGFHTIAAPPSDLRNFIYASQLDSIATNIATLLPSGEWLNPMGYANRDAETSYRPYQYSTRLNALINQMPRESSFLMVHFCLPHWPYWSKSHQAYDLTEPFPFDSNSSYLNALHVADNQFESLLRSLRERGMLEDAILFVYSDHGEELGLDKDRKLNSGENVPAVIQGHGTSIFDATQNQVLLAVQRYRSGVPELAHQLSDRPVSLIDIQPTVLSKLGIPFADDEFDGIDLTQESHSEAVQRARFIESAMSSVYADTENVNKSKLISELGRFYTVNSDLSLTINPDSLGNYNFKQRGVLYRDTVIGLTGSSLQRAVNADAIEENNAWAKAHWRPDDDVELGQKDIDRLKKMVCSFYPNAHKLAACGRFAD
ncbi:hypothetical protein T35B1_09019 [Salinisphaera shabanensis T35B1]|uniref:sulfatase-like hydrolase/transferase n=1 Tax=Salinisphaera shabanensis TaxID=180542 RepID=UPI0033408A16